MPRVPAAGAHHTRQGGTSGLESARRHVISTLLLRASPAAVGTVSLCSEVKAQLVLALRAA